MPQQDKCEYARQDHVQRNLPFKPVVKLVSLGKVPQEDDDPCWRIEQLRLYIGVNRHAAIWIGIPERKNSVPDTPRDIRNQRQVKLFNIEGNVGPRIE